MKSKHKPQSGWRALSTAQATVIAALIAAVPAIIASVFAFNVGKSASQAPVAALPPQSIELEKIFGRGLDGKARARLVPANENELLLNEQFNRAQRSIKIVTLRGNWLFGNQETYFNKAVRNVNVEVLMLDYKDDELYKMVQDAVSRDGQGVLPQARYAESLVQFSKLFRESKGFTVGVTRDYPWTRFTIFDDRAVSFILTPTISGGPSAQAFFTDDPALVKTFLDIYVRSRRNASVFLSESEAVAFAK
jgi:hypothetical protein